jgi:hypothetical protein
MRLRPHKEIMRRLLFACCLLFAALVPCMARAVLLDGLRFAPADAGRCAGLANPAQRPMTLAALAPQHYYCMLAQFDVTQAPAQAQVLALSALASTELVLDGVLVGSNGVPAATAAGEREGLIDYRLTLAPAQLAPGRHTLLLKMSTWHASAQVHMLFHDLSLRDQSSLRSATLNSLPALLLAGALALAALLFAGLIVFYQRSARWCVFLLLCVVACSLLLVEAWRELANYAYGWHLLRLWSVTALSAAFALLLPAYYLLASGVRRPLPVLAALALALLGAALAVPWFDGRAALMFMIALLASAAINLLAWRRGRDGARTGLAVSLLSIGVFVLQGVSFARTGFALVVCLLLSTILVQLLRRFVRERDRAVLATRFENQLLRKSLQPHFLMNALSLIGELVHQSPARAESYIEALGREFRMLVDYAHRHTIALDEELALCHNYLEIMGTRYQRRFTLEVRGAATLALPPAVLLTCLENAFSHNRYGADVVFKLEIDAHGGVRRLRLYAPSAHATAAARPHGGGGTGLGYIRQSLADVFGARAAYAAEQRDGAWLSTITVPCGS